MEAHIVPALKLRSYKSFEVISEEDGRNSNYIGTGNDSNRNFDDFSFLDINIITTFFSELTVKTNKHGDPFLTCQQLETFIQRAICGNKDLEKVKFNATYGEFNQIVYLFYVFYTIAVQIENTTSRKNLKLKYQNLLIENCLNFGKETYVMQNFHKAPKINPWKFAHNDSLKTVISKCSSPNT